MPRYPALYQINTRVRLTSCRACSAAPVTLDDFSDAELDRLAATGLRLGLAAQRLADRRAGSASRAASPTGGREFERTLPDLREDDIAGSGFAIRGYTVHARPGRRRGAGRLRERLRQRGLKLMLDFVPNHVALDHPWVEAHPEFFIAGSAAELASRAAKLVPAAPAAARRRSWPMAATRTSTAGPHRSSTTPGRSCSRR